MITTTDLATELATAYDITDNQAAETVRAHLEQLIYLDGRQGTVVSDEPLRNGSGNICGETITITDDAANHIRWAFAFYYDSYVSEEG